MARRRGSRLVFSTEAATCIRCGWPAADCRCSRPEPEPLPARIVARLRVERSGRKGKTVTVLEGLPADPGFLDEAAADLKKKCGTGGTVREGRIELQGDHRERLRPELERRGWTVKG